MQTLDKGLEDDEEKQEVADYLRKVEYDSSGIYDSESFPKVVKKSRQQSRVDERAQRAERNRQNYCGCGGDKSALDLEFAEQRKDESNAPPMYEIGHYPSVDSPNHRFDTHENIRRYDAVNAEYVSVYGAKERDYLHVGDSRQCELAALQRGRHDCY